MGRFLHRLAGPNLFAKLLGVFLTVLKNQLALNLTRKMLLNNGACLAHINPTRIILFKLAHNLAHVF